MTVSKYTSIGGQAVMEGVMMRGREKLAIAVRQPSGEIALTVRPNWRLSNYLPFMRLPFLRGIAAFVEALVVGIDSILYSAEVSQPEDVQLTKPQAVLSMLLGLAIGVLLFVLLPTWLVHWLEPLGWAPILLNLTEGLVRLSIFLSYELLVGLLPDMARLYQYHGAEHKSIHAYEAGEILEVQRCLPYSRFHQRCGTAFLLLVMLISIVFFAFFGWPNVVVRLLTRLALLPLVAGVAYEIIRFASQPCGQQLLGWLLSPSLGLQRATTREPDAAQLEVAVAALNGLLEAEPALRGQ